MTTTTTPGPKVRIEISGMQLNGKDYLVLSVGQAPPTGWGAAEYIERSADAETVARQLEWLAQKLRAKAGAAS